MSFFLNQPQQLLLIEEAMSKVNFDIASGKVIFPDVKNIFNAFNINEENIKCVIVGQDPYHNVGQANGYSFSVPKGTKVPPSLKNIYKEIENEYNYRMNFQNGCLNNWVNQGVVLLNSTLTVELNKPNSHKKYGWEFLTDNYIKHLSDTKNNLVFLLWGDYAKSKSSLVDQKNHLILTSAHPSPFSAYRGFFGNNHFLLTNKYLQQHNIEEINWQIV